MIAKGLASLFGSGAATTLDPLNPRDPGIVKMLGLGNESIAGVQVDETTVLGYPAFWRGINIISNGVTRTKPIIYRRDGEERERDTSHTSWNVMTKRANDLMSAAAFRKTLTAHAIGWGNGLGWIIRDIGQNIEAVTPLPPDKTGMVVIRDNRSLNSDETPMPGDQVKYFTAVGGKVKMINPENILHIKGLSHTGYWGLPVVDLMRNALGLGMAATEFGARFFGQGMTQSMMVFMPPGLDEEQQTDFTQQLKLGAGGLGNAHKFLIFENETKAEQLTIPPDSAQFLETREFEIRVVANVIGIQPHKLGDTARTSYASLEQANQEHLDDDLDPWLQVWEDEWEAKGLTTKQQENDTHYVEFNREALVRTNLEARTSRDQFERANAISTQNEIRARSNQSRIGPFGDNYLVPKNMMLVDGDGLPIVNADDPAAATEPEPETGSDFNELAIHEVERLATRATREAAEQAKNGGASFCEFLEKLPQWTKQPACLSPVMREVVALIRERLDVFTEAPYTADDLEINVIASADAIRDDAISLAKNYLER